MHNSQNTRKTGGGGKLSASLRNVGDLTLANDAALGFNFTDSETAPVLDVAGKTVTLNGNKNITVKVSAASDVRPKNVKTVLTSGGKFTGATVSLASGAPDWASRVKVENGEIVLVKRMGTMVVVR